MKRKAIYPCTTPGCALSRVVSQPTCETCVQRENELPEAAAKYFMEASQRHFSSWSPMAESPGPFGPLFPPMSPGPINDSFSPSIGDAEMLLDIHYTRSKADDRDPPELVDISEESETQSSLETAINHVASLSDEDREKLQQLMPSASCAIKKHARKIYKRRLVIRDVIFVFDDRFSMPRDEHGNTARKLWTLKSGTPREEVVRRPRGRPNTNIWTIKAEAYGRAHPNEWRTRSHLGTDANLRGGLQPATVGVEVPRNTPLRENVLYLTQIEADNPKERRVYFCVLQKK